MSKKKRRMNHTRKKKKGQPIKKLITLNKTTRKINTAYEKAKLYKEDKNKSKSSVIKKEDAVNLVDNKIKNLIKLVNHEKLQNFSPKNDFHQVTNITCLNKMNENKIMLIDQLQFLLQHMEIERPNYVLHPLEKFCHFHKPHWSMYKLL